MNPGGDSSVLVEINSCTTEISAVLVAFVRNIAEFFGSCPHFRLTRNGMAKAAELLDVQGDKTP